MLNFLVYAILSISQAEVTKDYYDQKGQVVKVIYNTNSPNIAIALAKPGAASVTIINPNLMKKFSYPTQTFIYFHEAGHHSMGHLINNSSTTMVQEQESDCFSIRVALTLSLIKHSDLEIIQKEIAGIGNGDWQHLSGATRSLNISKCLGEGYQEKPWELCREKFYSNLNTFKNATPPLKQMLGICKKFGKKSSQCLDAKNLSLQLHQGLASSTAMIDQQCPFVMDPNYVRVMFDYGQVFRELNN